MSKVLVDARRLLCPMPVIRVQNAAADLAVGSLVEATCTDPGALSDIPAWARIHGHKVVETKTVDEEVIILIEIGERD